MSGTIYDTIVTIINPTGYEMIVDTRTVNSGWWVIQSDSIAPGASSVLSVHAGEEGKSFPSPFDKLD